MRRILVYLLVSWLCNSIFAQTIDIAKQIYESANPSVFVIYLNDDSGKPVAFGTGFEIAPRTIATNAHVIKGGSPVLAFGPIRIPAHVVNIDEVNDLAILTVDADLTSVPLTLAKGQVTPGEQIFAIGNPEGLEKTISQGIVSGIRKIDDKSLLQITSPISHGSSGGPVLNARGEVVGVAVGMLEDGQNLNFAVPVSYLSELILRKAGGGSTSTITPSQFESQVKELSDEKYSADADSPYRTKIEELRYTVRESTQLSDQRVMRDIFCLGYSKAPDEIGDAVIELGKKLLALKDAAPSEIHAVMAYELAEGAVRTEAGNEQSQLITEAEKEANLALSLGKVGNATADYAIGTSLSLDKHYSDALRPLLRALGDDNKRFACGYDLEYPIYSSAVAAAEDSGNHAEAERLFSSLLATGSANGFDWDAEGDRRAKHQEYVEAAVAYKASEDFFPINSCYSSTNFSIASGDHTDDVLSEGRKCIEAASKLNAEQSQNYAVLIATVHGDMADGLNDRGVYTEALSHSKDGISLDPKSAYLYYEEARAQESLGRSQECKSAAQQAVILSDGKYSLYHFQLGNCYFDTEDWVAAENSFRSAADEDKQDAASAFNLGLCLKRQGYGADARVWFEEALKRNPSAELKSKIVSALQ